MFAEARCALGGIGFGVGEAEGETGVAEGGAVPVGDFMPPVAGEELGVLEDVGNGHDRAGEEAGVLRAGDGVEFGDVGEEVFDGLVDLVAEFGTAGGEAVVVELVEE